MPEIGVRELKAHASEIIRKVHNERVRYTITRRGQPVGLIVPLVEEPPVTDADDAAWEQLFQTMDEIARDWPEGVDSVALLSEMRR